MKRRFAAGVLGVSTLTASVGIALAGGVAANAATPAYEGGPDSIGTIAFFNSSGVQITSGNLTDSPFAAYAVGSNLPAAGQALLDVAQPNPNANIETWNKDTLSGPNSFPITTAGTPSDISSLDQTHPVVAGASGDETLKQFATAFPSNMGSYSGLFQFRLETSNGSSNTDNSYDAADVLVSGNTWTEVYGTPIATTTTVSSGENPSVQGDNVTFTATETGADNTHPGGSFTFSDGGTTIGTATANGSGVGTFSTSSLTHAASPHSITATFTPTASSSFPSYSASAPSAAVSQVVGAPATPTTTSLTIGGNTQTGTDATLSGSVSPTAAGSVEFFDTDSATPTTPLAVTGGPSITVSGGTYSATLTGGFSAGDHSVVATFTPQDPTSFAASQTTVPFSTILAGGVCATEAAATPPAGDCTDTQNIKAEIPTGTLVISTPYTATNPLDLGTLQLNSTGTEWTGNKPFQCITVTDTEGVNTGFVAQALATTLSRTAPSTPTPAGTYGSIDGQNVGLTGLAPTPATEQCNGAPAVNSYTGAPASITSADAPAAAGVAPGTAGSAGLGGSAGHTILTGSSNHVGTATYDGVLTLNAPTSTAPGTYEGQITFTVSDGN